MDLGCLLAADNTVVPGNFTGRELRLAEPEKFFSYFVL